MVQIYIVDRGLIVLFFSLFLLFFGFFSVALPLENFLPTPCIVATLLPQISRNNCKVEAVTHGRRQR